jgi:penicillin amidase
MKRAGKIAAVALVLLACALAAGYAAVRHLMGASLPEYDGTVMLPGLESKVTVYRDAFGVPHLYAENERDLYLATGYVMAQDRLWQMDLMRRVTTGRLSEILGEDMVDTDLLFRALRIPEKSKDVLKSSDRNMVEGLEAFAAGVNAFIEQSRGSLPVEFTILGYEPEPWRPEHSLNLIGYLADWDASLTVIPKGVSGNPASPHYCDQTQMYLEGRYHGDLFSRKAVEKGARHILVLKGS